MTSSSELEAQVARLRAAVEEREGVTAAMEVLVEVVEEVMVMVMVT